MRNKRKKIYIRTHRHRDKNKLKNPTSVRRHTRISGRTGRIKCKQTPSSKKVELSVQIPNTPTWWFQL